MVASWGNCLAVLKAVRWENHLVGQRASSSASLLVVPWGNGLALLKVVKLELSGWTMAGRWDANLSAPELGALHLRLDQESARA